MAGLNLVLIDTDHNDQVIATIAEDHAIKDIVRNEDDNGTLTDLVVALSHYEDQLTTTDEDVAE